MSRAFISDVHLLETLSERIASSGATMNGIDVNVGNYLQEVLSSLRQQLGVIQSQLSQSESSLSAAEDALRAKEEAQAMSESMGMPCESSAEESSAVASAQIEVDKWRERYGRGQQIVSECEREIDAYYGGNGAHSLILTLTGEQMPHARRFLTTCINNLYDVLAVPLGVESYTNPQQSNDMGIDSSAS